MSSLFGREWMMGDMTWRPRGEYAERTYRVGECVEVAFVDGVWLLRVDKINGDGSYVVNKVKRNA